MSREIKNYILNYNDLEKLFYCLDMDFKGTIEGIFSALFVLVKNYDKNKLEVEYLMYVLKEQVDIRTSDELKIMIGLIIDFQNKVNTLKLKERIKIKCPCFEIQNMFNSIQMKLANRVSMQKMKCLEFLIFYDKNIQMVESYIKDSESLLNIKNKDGDNIFLTVLKKYLAGEEELDYLYQVIIVFLKSKYGEMILNQKEKYIELISSYDKVSMKKVVRLIRLFDNNYTVTLEELEKRYNVHFSFPESILYEMNTFKMKNRKRVDYTKQDCITIDGGAATCLDDALYMEKNDNGTYSLYIHIIDIPSFVPYDSITREEASIRGETLYLRDRSLLLYPYFISNEVCSLLPNNYRNTITYIFNLDSRFNVIADSFDIKLGKIKVKHRLTYEEVDSRIKKGIYDSLDEMLIYLLDFACVRRRMNKEKEIYREYENLIDLKPNHESVKIDFSDAANIVHESMILANYQVAKTFKELSLPYIYRKLNVPSQEYIEKQLEKLKRLGAKLEHDNGFISNLKDSYIEPIYCTSPNVHIGLNLECYSHSTSPARRYMDSLGQYIIHDLLIDNNITDKNIDRWGFRIDKEVQYINERKKENEKFAREYNYLSYKKLIKE